MWIMSVHTERLFIESWSGSAGYLAEMLTEGAQSWWVELGTLVNIKAKYPKLTDCGGIE